MGLTSDDAIIWTAKAEGDRTAVARHPDGHRVAFAFSGDARNEVEVRDQHWAAEGDHAADLRAAAVAARIVATAKGWLY